MSKQSHLRKSKKGNNRRQAGKRSQRRDRQEEKRPTSQPWLSRTTGFRTIAVISLLLAAFIAWQVWPEEGPIQAILWGLGFGTAIWAVFFLALAFNKWVRGRNNG